MASASGTTTRATSRPPLLGNGSATRYFGENRDKRNFADRDRITTLKNNMHTVTIDSKYGLASIDSTAIEIDQNGVLVGSTAKLCSPSTRMNDRRTRYQLLRKVNVCGYSANGMIEVGEGRAFAITFLFDVIEFFTSSILESKVIKACEKSLNLKFVSDHPSTAYLDSCEWGGECYIFL